MSLIAYLKITGSSQGEITSGVTDETSVGVSSTGADHTDEMMVVAWGHNVMTPRDPASGQATGKRIHNPLKITKYIDKSSPMLFQALCTGERLDCELHVYRMSPMGEEEHFYTILLGSALLVDITSESFPTYQTETANYHPVEHLQFTYNNITWTHEASGTSAVDDWKASRS